VALAVGLTGCGGGSAVCLPDSGVGPREAPVTRPVAYLTDVGVRRAGCADRVVLTFSKHVPGYRIAYAGARQAQTEDASGRHVAVAGSAFLVVRLANTRTARTHGGTLTPTYAGARRVRSSDARHVLEVVKTGDFEAVVTWAIGLDGRRPFAVTGTGRSLVVEIG
jgi:hypothetical protein